MSHLDRKEFDVVYEGRSGLIALLEHPGLIANSMLSEVVKIDGICLQIIRGWGSTRGS